MNYTQLFAKMMGKHNFLGHIQGTITGYCLFCGEYTSESWSPSPDGIRISYEVMDFMKKELPKEWERYLNGFVPFSSGMDTNTPLSDFVDDTLSIDNLGKWIVDHWKEIFMEECPKCSGEGRIDENQHRGIGCFVNYWTCKPCNGTGLILKDEKWRGIVEYMEKEGKDGNI